MVTISNNTWFERVPKVELHLHLEGAIPYGVLWELLKKYGGDPSAKTLEALNDRFVFRDFPHFLETWGWKNGFIREYDDFVFLAEAVARDLAAQNIRYVEAFCTPSDFRGQNLQTQKIATAIRTGLSKVPNIKVNLVVDFCRDRGIENAEKNLAEIAEVKGLGVIGFTIGGSEQKYPPGPFAAVYKKARKLGFHTSAHAGEAAGPESVWSAIRDLKVERIGHGTRICEDPALEEYVIKNRIPLEICPISNVKTRVVDSLENHPVRRYFEKGAVVTINTDDPKMFGNSLAEEYRTLHSRLGFSLKDIQEVIINGIRSSWLPDNEKNTLAASFNSNNDWNPEPCSKKS
jgi:adenosine deaminase